MYVCAVCVCVLGAVLIQVFHVAPCKNELLTLVLYPAFNWVDASCQKSRYSRLPTSMTAPI